MRCEACGQELPPLPEDDTIDLTNDDEQELVVAPMNIQGQCNCNHPFHLQEGMGDDRGRCNNDGKPENGGLCTPCLFGCAP